MRAGCGGGTCRRRLIREKSSEVTTCPASPLGNRSGLTQPPQRHSNLRLTRRAVADPLTSIISPSRTGRSSAKARHRSSDILSASSSVETSLTTGSFGCVVAELLARLLRLSSCRAEPHLRGAMLRLPRELLDQRSLSAAPCRCPSAPSSAAGAADEQQMLDRTCGERAAPELIDVRLGRRFQSHARRDRAAVRSLRAPFRIPASGVGTRRRGEVAVPDESSPR